MTNPTTEEQIELRHLGQDLDLFLRMAATNFSQKNDLKVIARLRELASEYAHGKDIFKSPDTDQRTPTMDECLTMTIPGSWNYKGTK